MKVKRKLIDKRWLVVRNRSIYSIGPLHLCKFDHVWVTVNPAAARENGWSVSAYQDPATVPALLARHGLVYLTSDGQTIPTERTAA